MKLKDSTIHQIVITTLIVIVASTVSVLLYLGFDYYSIPLEERHFHPLNQSFKASGLVGHGLGIVGSLLILFGVLSYMFRKRVRLFSRIGILKHWLEFHIFLCTLGPFLILFHTTFKFGGIVAVSFWSMVAVFLSGIIGRYIYLQIPRSIEGQELTLLEIEDQKSEMNKQLRQTITLDESIYELIDNVPDKTKNQKSFFGRRREERLALRKLRGELKSQRIPHKKAREIVQLYRSQLGLKKRIGRLVTMQKLFAYWHVAHLPFAFIMLVVMIIHVVVAVTFGYKWIF
ncbi:MAG: hypothetical protein M0R39_08225 [Prolixibacteraceae bacterium]|nr:hypothetical protein [Prolixibacteraceae bacterium]